MTRPLTPEDKRIAFMRATSGTEGAAERWRERAAKGMTGAQLADALKREMGVFGGSSPREGCPGVIFQGNGLRIWASWSIQNYVTERPVFQGAATVAMAREVYGVRDPDNGQMQLF
jgi:hypothetical protein